MAHDPSRLDRVGLLERARQGDEQAFEKLVIPHRRELLAHCYRMLGSLHDADDAVQDTFLRAWRSIARFEGRSTVRTWLYKIATNVCLNRIERSRRRYVSVDVDDLAALSSDSERWIDPFPSRHVDVESEIDRLESVELAFVAAVQRLPASQRAVLLLRDVLGFTAAETATLLSVSEATVTSRLQRARSRVRDSVPAESQSVALSRLGDRAVQDLAARYVAAWERQDASALVDLLTDDIEFSMPPEPIVFRGADAVADFLVALPMQHRWRVIPTRANGQLAFAAYLLEPKGQWMAHSIDVVEVAGAKISSIIAFRDPRLFTLFGLPAKLEPYDHDRRELGQTRHADDAPRRIDGRRANRSVGLESSTDPPA